MEQEADALLAPRCGCIQSLPIVGSAYKTYELKRSLIGVELAIAFQTIIGRVVAQVAGRKGGMYSRLPLCSCLGQTRIPTYPLICFGL